MDYQKHYNLLIALARNRQVPAGYTEKHHVLPRSLGGLDDKDNLVVLTAKEHYIAHHLLYHIYKNHENTGFGAKMSHAWFCMCSVLKNNTRYTTTARSYNKAKEEFVTRVSGNNHHNSDKEIYTFISRYNTTFSGTRHDFTYYLQTLGIENIGAKVHEIVYGSVNSDLKWALESNITDEFFYDMLEITNGIISYKGFDDYISNITNIPISMLNYMKTKVNTVTDGFWLTKVNNTSIDIDLKIIYSKITKQQAEIDSIEKLIRWYHPEYGLVECSVQTMIDDYKMHRDNINMIRCGACEHYKYWVILKDSEIVTDNYIPVFKSEKTTKTYIGKFIKKEWYHPVHGVVIDTLYNVSLRFNVDRNRLYDLCSNIICSYKFWCMNDNKRIKNSVIVRYAMEHIKYKFVNGDITEHITCSELASKYNLIKHNAKGLITGKFKKCEGWEILNEKI